MGQYLLNTRKFTCEFAFAFALVGIILMILSNEFKLAGYELVSQVCMIVLAATTFILVVLTLRFHQMETKVVGL